MMKITTIKTLIIFSFVLFINADLLAQSSNHYQALSQGFQNPPHQAQPIVYHWWLGGYVDTVRLKQEFKSFKDMGISGMTIFEIGSRDTALVKTGPAYLGPESLQTLKFAIEEAGKLGLSVGLNTASSWNAGGNWIPPKHAAKSIYQASIELKRNSGSSIKLPFPEIPEKDPRGKLRLIEFGKDGKPVFYEEIAVLAIPANMQPLDTGKIINVSAHFNPETGILEWNAPEGDWQVTRYICSNSGENLVLPSPESAGPIVDHFDAEATKFHFNYIIDRLKSVLGDDLSTTALKSLYMASYEAKGFTWTITLPQEFKQINGYDVYKFLPALFAEDVFKKQAEAHFRSDFQRILSELMINNFYVKSREICHQHGLKNNSESGGPGLPLHNVPVEPIKALGSLDIPRGEFWINHPYKTHPEGIDILRVVKEVSAASHIYGRDLVEMEAFTTTQQWQEGPFEMKPVGDRAFCEGMNKVVVHGSTHNPAGTGYPGIAYGAGTHYNDKRVWWPKIKPFNEYLARVSYILQEADFQADVAFYYGDTIPNYGGHKNSRFTVGPGYDYEIFNTEKLLELEVKNGRLILPSTGAEFKLLALTDEYEIHPEVLLKLEKLASQGALIAGKKPHQVATRKITAGMPKVKGLIDKLWTTYNPANWQKQKNKVLAEVEPAELLSQVGVGPDISYQGDDFYQLDFIHYAKDDLDYYFIRNATDQWLTRQVNFRQQNKIPEFWDPATGEIIPVPVYQQVQQNIEVPISLAPYQSLFVAFRTGNQEAAFSAIEKEQFPPRLQFINDGLLIWDDGKFKLKKGDQTEIINNKINRKELTGAWEVNFPEGKGAPERVIMPELKSWTEVDQESVKYFSGIASYKKTYFHVIHDHDLKDAKIFLDLGDLSHVAEVWLNDKSLGIAWAKPYRFDITDELKPGQNTLVVEVANTWSNRLVGDAITGKKFTSTNKTNSIVPGLNALWLPWKEVPLIRSGLFGPVEIVTVQPVKLDRQNLMGRKITNSK